MAVTYTWVFNPLDVKLSEDGMTNVVYNVNWRLIGTDGTYSDDVYGSVGVPAPSSAAFTPYDQLTEDQVRMWVLEALGVDQVLAYEQSIAAQIVLQQKPVDASLPPPWSNT
jgi:hypothetical protein